MTFLLMLLFWLLSSIADASVISDLAATMAPGDWEQFSTNNTAALHDNVSGGVQHVIPYADGIQWDPVLRRGLMLTSDDPGNRYLIVYDEETNTWSQTLVSEGRLHQYDGFSCDLIKRLCVSVGGDGSQTWTLDMNTLALPLTTRGPVPGGFSNANGGAWFPERGGFVLLNGTTMQLFNTTTLVWSNVGSLPSGITEHHSLAEHNPRHHVMVFGGGTGLAENTFYKMDAAGTVTRLGNAPTTLESPRAELVYEPVTGKFLLLRSNDTFWEYEVRTDTWTNITSTANVPAQLFETSDANQLNTVAMSIPAYGVIMWVNCEFQSCTTWLYKHAKSQWHPIPYQYDEEATYTNKFTPAWIYTTGDKPNIGNQSSYSVANVNNHNDIEGDDLWTNLMMWYRTGQNGYKQRADAWARYFKDDYRQCVGTGETYCDDGGFLFDHLQGWGLILYYEETGNSAYLTAAENLAVDVETRAASITPGSTAACYYECRKWARHSLLATRIANAIPISRWITLRDKMCNVLYQSPDWDSRGMYFASEEATDTQFGAGTYDGGRRMMSTFQIGLMGEALWQCHLATGRTDIRDRLIAMATYVKNNGLEPTYQYTGSRIGFQGAAPWWNYNFATFVDSVYTISLVNIQVMGYKLTGDVTYLDSAKVFLNRGSKGPIGGGLPGDRTAPDDEVFAFVDAQLEVDGFYYKWNKGALQYTYLLFENGGHPTIISLSEPPGGETPGGPLHKPRLRWFRLG